MIYPDKNWLQYSSPEDAGWSSEKLSKAYNYYKKIGTDALLVIYKGAVLLSWGEIERRFLCHSVRKSLLSALVGIYQNKGKIDLNETLDSLGIDDIPPLSKMEKKARVMDLLKSRSGVYHTAQYEGEVTKPKRDSVKPGSRYFYNNWDFNTLNTIFEQQTGERFFTAFRKKIASPLQMEEFRLTDGYYYLEEGFSIHSAYPLRMSARDLARFGLLYLNNGKWKNKQVIPENWIKRSTKAYSFDNDVNEGFGFMWFISNDFSGKGKMFSSLGNGGQCISILPGEDLIFIHRVNTFEWKKVSNKERLTLFGKILDAKISTGKQNDSLQGLKTYNSVSTITVLAKKILNKHDKLVNTYTSKEGTWKIQKHGNNLLMTNFFGDKYKMLSIKEHEFILEDSNRKVSVKKDNTGQVNKIIVYYYPKGKSILYPSKTK
ncbi:MAG: serine hydrolase [Ignavibacteria bacterium]